MTIQDVVDLITGRQSIGHLVEPAPNELQIRQAIEVALTAPDHHRLRPWRFLTIEGDERYQFGQLLSDSLAEDGQLDPIQLERVKQHPLRAPMILLCIMSYHPHLKVPHYEQVLSCGAAIQNLLLTLQVQGFSTIWRSGAIAESPSFKRAIGCGASDEVAGLIYIGTSPKAIAPRQKLNVDDFLKKWHSN